MTKILLSSINARFSHANLGLRWLMANLGEYQSECKLLEFTLSQRPVDMLEEIVTEQPHILGLGIYIWNIELMTQLIPMVRKVLPDTIIIAGGPEISYHSDQTPFYQQLDHIIVGEGEEAFYQLCHHYLSTANSTAPSKMITPHPPDLAQLKYPYHLFSDEDIQHRNISVEASRGCPFGCQFCLSSLDRWVRYFPQEQFLNQLEQLWQRGVRKFKFIDRTFNLPKGMSQEILQFFLNKKEEYFLHFEMVPDHFPAPIKALIEQFPPHSLQFEIGIQSFNSQVAARIGRHQDYNKIEENLSYLSKLESVHIHADLIVGLPGETFESIGEGIDRLYGLSNGEIQIGILKKLKGAPIAQHDQEFKMVYQDYAPYEILQNSTISFDQMMELKRLARFWDLIVNSGHFTNTLSLLIKDSAFKSMLEISKWIFAQTKATHKMALDRLAKLIATFLIEVKKLDSLEVQQTIDSDYQYSAGKGLFFPAKQKNQLKEAASQIKGVSRQNRHSKN